MDRLRGYGLFKALPVLCAVLGTISYAPVSASATGPATTNGDFKQLMKEGKAAKESKNHANAIDSFARAYRSLPASERTKGKGPIAINNALEVSLDLLDLGNTNTAILQSAATLFREHLTNLGDKSQDPVLSEHLAALDAKIEQFENPTPVPLPEPVPSSGPVPEPEPEPSSGPVPEPEPEPDYDPVPEPKTAPSDLAAHSVEPTETPSRVIETTDIVWLSAGGASFVGGVVMLGVGGWVFRETDARIEQYVAEFQLKVDEAFAQDRTDSQRQNDAQAIAQFGEDTLAYRASSRARATTLVVMGSVLAATGVGLVTWRLLRLRRNRQSSANATLMPALNPCHAGASFSMSF